MNKTLRVGIVGYGYWGPNLVRNFSEQIDAEVVWIADKDISKFDLISRRYPAIKTTTEVDDILQDASVDAVVVATPVNTHYKLALTALQADKHVWIEKPMTETSEEAEHLLQEAKARNRIVFVDHTFIYTGAVRHMSKLIRSNELGTVFYYDSQRVNLGLFQRDVNVISDLAVHDFSILDHLLGEHPIAITASGTNHFPGTPENLAYVTLYYQSGTIAHVNVSWLAPVKVRQTLIGGSQKMIVYDDLEPSEKLKIYDKGVSFTEDEEQIYNMRVGYRTGDMIAPKLETREALGLACEHFMDCISTSSAPSTDGHMGMRVVQLVEAATLSMRARGETVSIPSSGVANDSLR